jgi:hypothetical protein
VLVDDIQWELELKSELTPSLEARVPGRFLSMSQCCCPMIVVNYFMDEYLYCWGESFFFKKNCVQCGGNTNKKCATYRHVFNPSRQQIFFDDVVIGLCDERLWYWHSGVNPERALFHTKLSSTTTFFLNTIYFFIKKLRW